MLTKEQIARADDLSIKKIDVPEWEGHIFLTSLSGTDRADYDAVISEADGEISKIKDFRVQLLVRCICDDAGNTIFNEDEVSDLGEKSSLVLERLFKEACVLNGIGVEEFNDEVENLEQTQS